MSNNSFKVKNGLTLTPVDLTTLTTPQAGDLACDINDNNKIKRYDAASASWVEVGSGGVGSLDILFAQDFESASLSSFTQTGLALDTVDPLHGKVSAKLTHDASVNQSFKEVKAVDRKFRGQAIVMRLNVKSSASAGNVTISVYDETNAASLLSSTQLNLSNDVDGISNAVSFTIPSTSSSISYTITALPEAGSPVTFIDDIVAELSNVALLETSVDITTPVVTEWQNAGTVLISATTTAPTKGATILDQVLLKRNGTNAEIVYKYQQNSAGSAGSGDYLFELPNGLQFDLSMITPYSGSFSTGLELDGQKALIGYGHIGTGSGSSRGQVSIFAYNSTKFRVVATQAFSAYTAVSSSFYNAANPLSFNFQINAPINSWEATETTTKTIPLTQSGLVQEADSALAASGNAGQVITAAVTDIPFIATSMTGDAMSWSGSALTVLKAGIFTIDAQLKFTGAIERSANIYVNGVRVGIAGESLASTTHHASYNGYFQEGSVISIRTAVNGGTLSNVPAEHYLSVTSEGSLKQISVSSDQKITIPTSELRFEGASARGSTATAIVQFTSMAKLRGDAFTVESDSVLGTRITMNKAGKLDINANVYLAAASSIAITKNQSNLTISTTSPASEILSTQGSNSTANRASASWSGFVNVGDIIRVASETAVSSFVTNNLNLSFQEQDISVSVTNTLPQFSESDSSVRVDTANGYGSTATKIRRFSNVRDNIGVDISYVDDSANGATFTVLASGIYNISYAEQMGLGVNIGITKNATSLQQTTSVLTLAQSATDTAIVLANSGSTAQGSLNCSWQGYLSAGDIIRPHTDGSASTDNENTRFTISKVGKPNVTGVDVTPFVNVPQPDTQSSFLSSSAAFGNVDITGALTSSAGSGIYSYNSATGIYTFLKSSTVNISACLVASSTTQTLAQISLNGTQIALASSTTGGAGWGGTASWTGKVSAGDTLKVRNSNTGVTSFSYVSVTATTLSDQILTAPETFSTDTASLSYASSAAYTLSTLQNAPVGTFITFTYAANTNTRTQTTTRPTQTDADMNVNGIRIFCRNFTATSTASQPSAVAIQIGKGIKGLNINLYSNVDKSTELSTDFTLGSPAASTTGLLQSYNENTGILTISANGYIYSSPTRIFESTEGTTYTSGYLVINASKNPALTGLGFGSVVRAKYTSNSGQAVGTALTLLTMEDAVYDSNNAYVAGVYTVPENGTYMIAASWVTAAVAISASTGSMNIAIYVDGVSASNNFIRATGNTLAHSTTIADQFVLKKGQTISIYGSCTTATTMSSGSFSITKFSVVKDS
jgi:hypothetical protein